MKSCTWNCENFEHFSINWRYFCTIFYQTIPSIGTTLSVCVSRSLLMLLYRPLSISVLFFSLCNPPCLSTGVAIVVFSFALCCASCVLIARLTALNWGALWLSGLSVRLMVHVYRVCAYQKRDYLCVKSSSSCKRNEFKNGIHMKERIKSYFFFYTFAYVLAKYSYSFEATVTMAITNYGISAWWCDRK